MHEAVALTERDTEDELVTVVDPTGISDEEARHLADRSLKAQDGVIGQSLTEEELRLLDPWGLDGGGDDEESGFTWPQLDAGEAAELAARSRECQDRVLSEKFTQKEWDLLNPWTDDQPSE